MKKVFKWLTVETVCHLPHISPWFMDSSLCVAVFGSGFISGQISLGSLHKPVQLLSKTKRARNLQQTLISSFEGRREWEGERLVFFESLIDCFHFSDKKLKCFFFLIIVRVLYRSHPLLICDLQTLVFLFQIALLFCIINLKL